MAVDHLPTAPPAAHLPPVAQAAPHHRLVAYTPAAAPSPTLREWRGVANHSHMLRSNQEPFERACELLVAWCRQHGVRAIGVGSPWEPVSSLAYGRYETRDRDLYYSPDFDPQTVKYEDRIAGFIQTLNQMGAGHTLFYLDNETPKSRYGHLWWFGWHYDFPAWHDYSQDRPIMYYANDPNRELNARTGLPHRRRCYLEIVAMQRAAGALGIWAHPTSWWLGPQQQFVTNIASELPLHLLAEGHVDGMVTMGYDACHRPYQELWWHLLDRGYRIPGFAECDLCFDQTHLLDRPRALLTYAHLPGEVSVARIQHAVRLGQVYASSGARLLLSVDGVPMGGTVASRTGQGHRVRLELQPRGADDRFARVELLGRGGAVRLRLDDCPGGTFECDLPGSAQPDYVVVRAWGQHDDPTAPQQQIRDFCLSNPVYLRAPGLADPAPVPTALRLQVSSTSPWHGGRITFETAAGVPLWTQPLTAATITATVPATTRLRLVAPDGRQELRYLAMENEAVQTHLRYLHDGEFRRDYPTCSAGEVPPAAFRLDALAEAISTCTLTL